MNVLNYSKYKRKNKTKQFDYSSDILSIMGIYNTSMFDYTPPDGLLLSTCEKALTTGGICAFYKCLVDESVNYNKWCLTPAFPATTLDNNGIPTKITTYGSDYALELDVNVDCVLIFNNSMKQPDTIAERYSNLIDDIDKTIKILVVWCRAVPILKVHNNNDIAKYNKLIEKIIDGDLLNLLSDNINPLILPNGAYSKERDIIELGDASSAEKIHFLSELREEVIKRISTIYGIPFNTTAKSAQALNAELHGMDIFSLFVPFDRYKCRKEGFKRAQEFSGHNFNFGWSDIMKHQIKDIFQHAVENDVNKEDAENDSGRTTKTTSAD